MKTATYNYKRVYVWELAVRFFHWLTVLSLIVLVITGFIIADPPAFNLNVEAAKSYWFGYIRLIHFSAAYILIANLLFRIYWAFAGNQFANWRVFIPYTKKHWKNIVHVIKTDILLMKDKEQNLSNISIGHNSMAAFTYLIMTLLFILQAITGLALLGGGTSSWWLPKMFHWIVPLLGGDIPTRYLHHLFTWFFVAFVVIHVYLVLYHDYVEARGEVSSMISGFKFVRAGRIKQNIKKILGNSNEENGKSSEKEMN